jgi:hypothetical protein
VLDATSQLGGGEGVSEAVGGMGNGRGKRGRERERAYRGPNHRKSARGVLGSRDLAVRTVLMLGSVWSTEVLFCEENFVRSYCFR